MVRKALDILPRHPFIALAPFSNYHTEMLQKEVMLMNPSDTSVETITRLFHEQIRLLTMRTLASPDRR
ncbi:hypothetical protein JXB02_02385 [Candidatus Woesearchaeota archaeon]|nr:hypothetical protein [Candidatus Woesearchaeota archaeon]